MNPKQKLARGIGLGILILMGLVPPWKLTYKDTKSGETESSFAGYHMIWSKQDTSVDVDLNRTDVENKIDLVRIGIQFILALILINVAYYALKDRKTPTVASASEEPAKPAPAKESESEPASPGSKPPPSDST